MFLTIGEIRMLLGMCIRGIREARKSAHAFPKSIDRATLHNIEIEIEEQYDNLRVFDNEDA